MKQTAIPYDSDEFRQMWLEGVPLDEIGRRCGVGCSAVSHGARRAGLPQRRPGRRGGQVAEVIARDWYRPDVTLSDMAAEAGVAISTVWREAERKGLPPRRRALAYGRAQA